MTLLKDYVVFNEICFVARLRRLQTGWRGQRHLQGCYLLKSAQGVLGGAHQLQVPHPLGKAHRQQGPHLFKGDLGVVKG